MKTLLRESVYLRSCKCASTSIARMKVQPKIIYQGGAPQRDAPNIRPVKAWPHPKGKIYSPFIEMPAMGEIARRENPKAVIWTVIRNPWDRIVSMYHFLVRRHKEMIEFADFVDMISRDGGGGWHYAWHTKPVAFYASNTEGELQTDHILKFENLQEELNELFIEQPQLPHRNKSPNRHGNYRVYYTDAIAEEVGRIYQQDVRIGNYQF